METTKITIATANFNKVDYRPAIKQAILDEIELLRISQEINPRKWNLKKFNANDEKNCFYGQIFGDATNGDAEDFKSMYVGGISEDSIPERGYTESISGYSTLLEHWSVRMWCTKNKASKNEVLRVFRSLIAGKKVTNIKLHI